MHGNYHLEILDTGQDPLSGKSADAFVHFENGASYAVTLFTLEGIRMIMEKDVQTGECAGGAYFTCVDLLVLKQIDADHFRLAVDDLLKSGEFESVFIRCRVDNE